MDSDIVQLAQVLSIVAAFVAAMVGIGVGSWLYIRRANRRALAPPAFDADRLRHIEQAIDSIAIEVERISEAQRFSAKLLAERSGDSALR